MEPPVQSYEVEAGGSPSFAPSQRLLTAILLRAVRDYVTYREMEVGTEQHNIALDAAGWIFWNGREVMTFRYICLQIDLDPVWLRKVIQSLSKDDLLRMIPPVEE